MILCCSKTSQRNKQIAMGRKKFNMDPKKVGHIPSWFKSDQISRACWQGNPNRLPWFLLLLSRESSSCWKTTSSSKPQRTSPSSCTKARASTRRSSETTWASGENFCQGLFSPRERKKEKPGGSLVEAWIWALALPRCCRLPVGTCQAVRGHVQVLTGRQIREGKRPSCSCSDGWRNLGGKMRWVKHEGKKQLRQNGLIQLLGSLYLILEPQFCDVRGQGYNDFLKNK